MKDPEYKLFACEYEYEGNMWMISIYAKNADEASLRMRAIGMHGSVLGTIEKSYPGWVPRWVMNTMVWWNNLVGK